MVCLILALDSSFQLVYLAFKLNSVNLKNHQSLLVPWWLVKSHRSLPSFIVYLWERCQVEIYETSTLLHFMYTDLPFTHASEHCFHPEFPCKTASEESVAWLFRLSASKSDLDCPISACCISCNGQKHQHVSCTTS